MYSVSSAIEAPQAGGTGNSIVMSHISKALFDLDPDLTRRLRRIGILDHEQLRRIGSVRAWRRLVQAGLDDRLQSLLELEAAIEGTRWQKVSLERREELKLSAISFSQGE